MALMWAASLIFVLVFTGLGQSETIDQPCTKICPAGYYKVGVCGDAQYRCEKCKPGTYTAINNTASKCQLCKRNVGNEVVVKECSPDSNREFKCRDGYYYSDSDQTSVHRSCVPCYSTSLKRCLDCQRQECVNSSQCKKDCGRVPTPLKKNTTKTPTSTTNTPSVTSEKPRPKSTVFSANPAVDPAPKTPYNPETWLFFIVALVIFLVLSWFLLLFCRTLNRNQNSFLCCSPNKVVETPAQAAMLNGQHSHHGSSPATLVPMISEETPMIIQQPPAHICGQVPDGARMAVWQKEQSERWPAVVLYAIIKEVPLRRWKEFLRLLSVPDQQMERVELDASLGSIEKQYQMLRLWSQRSSASLNEVFSSLHSMDLLGCAQLLQESLEKLPWRPEALQGPTR
ncbi:tumor necrosis factor receptor superfamily member 1A [Nothobranchius furzeri]|uniref:Tumor necrosis factor receptor superfamily member 1A-like n=2 Tax=Nothobranchius furzeri TaxID=105023 RepID=A0A9D3BGZ1_NOTFU|nr:tumor necrosis factor receptor superfamily member 1A-like [Nothobranchius furzeri]